MFPLAVVSVFLALSFAAPFSTELDGEWKMYKLTYKKNYGAEEATRRAIWQDNLIYVETLNLEADRGEHSYRVGMNQYADMTTEEFVKAMNGFRMSPGTPKGATFVSPSNVELPTTVDWKTKGYVTGVKDQASCGSCWAFSATGSMEGQHFKKNGTLVSLSEQNLIDCSWKEGNVGCRGGAMDYAFNYVKKNGGIDTESSYPYQSGEGQDNFTCRYTPANRGATVVGHVDITQGSEGDLKKAVATIGPISVAIDAHHRSIQLYRSGIYYEKQCSSTRLDHGVLAVGYGSQDGQDYWLVKNSWGTGWGEDGYIQMSRNRDNNCGIATAASYPLV